jgi:hypothetical protein
MHKDGYITDVLFNNDEGNDHVTKLKHEATLFLEDGGYERLEKVQQK